jgi:MYXO-CTERM domain-containing protein
MNSTIKFILVAIMGSCLVSGSANAGWLPGGGSWEGLNVWNNTLVTPNPSTTYTFDITGPALTTWYWDGANGISFSDHSWSDINGGDIKSESMKFQFTQPISSFTFTTPYMQNQAIHTGNSLHWDMSVGDTNVWTSLWSYIGTASSPEYSTFAPETVATVNFATPVTQIRLKYYETTGGYCGYVGFTGAEGGSMAVTTADPIPEPAAASLLALAGLAGLARRRR